MLVILLFCCVFDVHSLTFLYFQDLRSRGLAVLNEAVFGC
jgi:hypothetical protein